MQRKRPAAAAIEEEEVLSNLPNIKNMGWLMADAVDDIYVLEDERVNES